MPAASTIAPASTMAPPAAVPASEPQHLRALEHANRIRLARAALKRAIKAGQADIAEVIRSCPWEVRTMTVSELLRSQTRWGRTRARKFLAPLALSENRQLGRLTIRQREVLASELEAKARSRLH